jgi:tricorn protease
MTTRFRRCKPFFPGLALALLACGPAVGQGGSPAPATPPAVTLRTPILFGEVAANRTYIVFSFAGDLWRVPRGGGDAERLTDHPGDDRFPAFSPDGSSLAFTRQAGGNEDVYVMPGQGGEARRLTWHPKAEVVRGWSPDGKRVLFASNRDGDGIWRLYTMASDGVMPAMLPFPEATAGAFSPEGDRIAYVPFSVSWDSWRHYRGGSTSPIWIARLADSTLEKREALSRPDANNRAPLWIGETLYFLSDRTGTPNLFSHDLRNGRTEQLTRLTKHGIRTAAAAPGAVVFLTGGEIHLYDLARREDRTVDVRLTVPAPELVARTVPAARFLETAVPTPSGDRLIVSARGEVLSFDPKTGRGENLTRTSGVAERSAAPSPDGRRLAWFSDASGEYELHVVPAGGSGETRRIAVEERPSFYRELTWSPDGRRIAFSDKRLALWVADLETARAERVAVSSHIGQGEYHPAWSPDGRWLAWSQALDNRVRTVFLWDARDGRSHQVTDGRVPSEHPVFDRSGRYLYFTTSATARTASADDLDWGVMSSALAQPLVTRRLNAAVLRKGDAPPLLAVVGEPHPGARWEPAAGEVEIDLAGLRERIVPLSGEARDFAGLAAGPPGVLFARVNEWPATPGGDEDPEPVLDRYVFSKGRKPERIAAGVTDFSLSADGSALAWGAQGQGGLAVTMLAAMAPVETERKPLDLAGLTVEVDPAAEWRQIYREVWRIARDWFYDPAHHGQDLATLERHYAAFLPGIVRRADLNDLFERMLGHLSVSHLVVGGGDQPSPAGPPERTGLLGADFEIHQGRYRIARIYRSGHPNVGNPLLRAPLDQPGVNVQEGDYLLAVDGTEVRADRNLYSYLAGKGMRPVEIRVAADPEGREVRTATVVPLPGENTLRRMDWAEGNRRRVEEMSGGRLAYVYLPNQGGLGYEELLRGLLGKLDADGVIVDQRYSPGGIVFDSVIEMLRSRPLYAYAWREGSDLPIPTNTVAGAKVLLINRQNGSAAETFAQMWKLAGLGPVLGTRTFGGGIGGALFSPRLVDGGRLTIPNRASYAPDGTWGIENDGVHPEAEIEWDPAAWRAGRDPQLEAAVAAALEEAGKVKRWAPKRPVYPKYP